MLAAFPPRRALGALVGCALACLGWLLLTAPTPVAAAQSVTDCGDTGTNTLRGRITAAAATDTITFAQDCTGATKIALASTLTLSKNLTIDGSGHTVVIDGGSSVTVFTVNNGVSATLKYLTIQHGNSVGGGGILNNIGGTLIVTNCTLTANHASTEGGAIENAGTMYVTNSTLSGNTSGDFGGAIANLSTLTLTNSTLSGNSATNGGGIWNDVGVTLTLTNTIVATNTATTGPDISGTVTTPDHNLLSSISGTTGITNGDAHGDIVNATPLLGPLGSAGGPTQTIPLLAGSPAIGHGNTTVCTNVLGTAPVAFLDQRGLPRVLHCSIGAFEPFTGVYTVGNLSDTGAMDTFANCQSGTNTTCKLRDALAYASSGVDVVVFDSHGQGPITLTNDPQHGTLTLAANVTIAGPTGGSVIVDGGCTASCGTQNAMNGVGVFAVNSGVFAAISNLTIQHGNAAGNGGGIFNQGTLTVTNCTITANRGGSGGGIDNEGGTLTVTNSTLSSNSASQDGGGIDNTLATLAVASSTFSGNTATSYGGSIHSDGPLTVTSSTFSGNSASIQGGGIFNDGPLTVTNSTLSGNTAPQGGGGIFNQGNTLTVTNSTFSGNTATGGSLSGGGGIFNGGTLTVTNSTFSNNGTSAGQGGGIFNNGTATVTGSTLAANTAPSGQGGGIENKSSLTLTNSTLSGNSASQGGGIHNFSNAPLLSVTNSTLSGNSAPNGFGGGIRVGAVSIATLTNTIVANTPTGGDVVVAGILNGTNNLIDDAATGTGFTDGTNHNIIGHPAGLAAALGSNGGPTQTIALLAASPAIGAGAPTVCGQPLPPATPPNGAGGKDQRGFLRQAAVCSIGAYEAQPAIPNPLPGGKSPGSPAGSPVALPGSRPGGAPNGSPNPLPAPRP